MELRQIIVQQKEKLQNLLDKTELALGEILFNNNDCQVMSQSAVRFELMVGSQDSKLQRECMLEIESTDVLPSVGGEYLGWERNTYACLLQVEHELQILDPKTPVEHKKYTRQGMIKRVLLERRQKADKAKYRVKWASNIYGDHILTNEHGLRYKIFLRDFQNETGYSDSFDSRLNKLGTTKHIMFAFNQLKGDTNLYNQLDKTCPFIEIYCDPLIDNKISWFYPHKLPVDEQLLISRYFKQSTSIEDEGIKNFLGFIQESANYPLFRIRPEVQEKVEAAFEQEMLANLRNKWEPDFSLINASLYPYQKEGIEFALFRNAAIIADEMGLGKTIQAIGTALLKKQVFGFKQVLVVCPASLKEQWKKRSKNFPVKRHLSYRVCPMNGKNNTLITTTFSLS